MNATLPWLIPLLTLALGLALGVVIGLWLKGRERNSEIDGLRATFQALSSEALRQSNEQFLQLAQSRFGELTTRADGTLEAREKAVAGLVKPIAETLAQVQKAIADANKQAAEGQGSVQALLRQVTEGHTRLQAETANLVKALRRPQVRGRWGEMQLRRVVELAGMLDHCDFVEQESTDDGRLRPDLIVRLPGGKRIIVDAKAPLEAYLEALEAPDDTLRDTHLQQHARQVRDHMTRLSQKSYWDQFDNTPELVFMFLPGETFYISALQQDGSLLEHGAESKVIPASPVTLIALLRAVHYGWRQERLAENAHQISELGRELYRRLRTLGGHLGDIGSRLEKTVDSYNKAVGSLERSVMPGARRFMELDAGTGDEIPALEPVDLTPRRIESGELGGGNPQ